MKLAYTVSYSIEGRILRTDRHLGKTAIKLDCLPRCAHSHFLVCRGSYRLRGMAQQRRASPCGHPITDCYHVMYD